MACFGFGLGFFGSGLLDVGGGSGDGDGDDDDDGCAGVDVGAIGTEGEGVVMDVWGIEAPVKSLRRAMSSSRVQVS